MKYEAWDIDYELNSIEYDARTKKTYLHGFEIEKLEYRLSEIANRKHAVCVASATDALQFSLGALNVGEGDEVLVTDFSWISTASCVSLVGAIPVFCDIDPETYHISLDSIRKMTSEKTKALIYTPLFGNMSDVTEILKYCEENDIAFVEDSAQSIGSKYDGRPAGSFGEISSYSFNENKNISGISGGGVVLTDNDEYAYYARAARRHGFNDFLGRNSMMFAHNAAIIDLRLDRLDNIIKNRQRNAIIYNELLSDFKVQQVEEKVVHNRHKYVVEFEDHETREQVRNHLDAKVHYPCISSFPMWEKLEHRKDDCIHSKYVSDRILTLPCHPYMLDDEVEYYAHHIIMLSV